MVASWFLSLAVPTFQLGIASWLLAEGFWYLEVWGCIRGQTCCFLSGPVFSVAPAHFDDAHRVFYVSGSFKFCACFTSLSFVGKEESSNLVLG